MTEEEKSHYFIVDKYNKTRRYLERIKPEYTAIDDLILKPQIIGAEYYYESTKIEEDEEEIK